MAIKKIILATKKITMAIKKITMAIKKMITNTWWIFFCLANQSFSSSFSFTSLGVSEWGCKNGGARTQT